MKTQLDHPGIAHLPGNGLYTISGVAALVLGILFLSAMLSFVIAGIPPSLADNWLALLFKLNAGFNGVQYNQLYGPNLIDMTLLVLVVIVYLGLYAALRPVSRFWSLIAALIPPLGIILFIITKLAGRSGFMGAGIVISFVMLRSNVFSKAIAFVGILANVLLLVGDFGTAANSPSAMVAASMGIGYVLLLTWLFLLARRLFQLGQNVSQEQNL